MREIAEAIINHIKTEFPTVDVTVKQFTARNGILIDCEIWTRSDGCPHWECVTVEVFPEGLELREKGTLSSNYVPKRTKLEWEDPNTFEMIDDALKKLGD